MHRSSSASHSSGKTQARRPRPPSPVSLYGGGLFGPVKSPPPLPTPRPKRDSNNSHSRTASGSTSTSHKSDDSSSSNSHGSHGRKSLESFIPVWKKKKSVSVNASLPSSPMPGVCFRSQTTERRLDDDFVPTLAEARVRQLNKATRTFGERVPVEYIVQGEIRPTPIVVSDSKIHSHPDDLSPVDIIPSHDFPSSQSENSSPHSSRTSSPVLPSQDRYHYRKKTPTLAPITNSLPPSIVESRSESPILFSQFPNPPNTVPQHPQFIEKTKTDTYIPLVLRQPQPTKPFSTLPTTSLPDIDIDSTPTKAVTLPQRALKERAHANAISSMFNEDPVARPESPFQNSTVPLHAWLSTTFATRKDPPVRQENGQGWVGEWNRNDMQDVISQLRHLK